MGELWAFVLMATSRRIDSLFEIIANGYGFKLNPQVGNNCCDLFFFALGVNKFILNDDELDQFSYGFSLHAYTYNSYGS